MFAPKNEKTAALRVHAKVRADERFAIEFTKEKRRELISLIQQSGKSPDKCCFIAKQSNSRSVYVCEFDGMLCKLIYDKKRKEIVTFLYPDPTEIKLWEVRKEQFEAKIARREKLIALGRENQKSIKVTSRLSKADDVEKVLALLVQSFLDKANESEWLSRHRPGHLTIVFKPAI